MNSSYSYGSFNRLTATNTATYTNDSNGSRTARTSAAWTYGWDRENRMTSAGSGLASVTYAYDALGRRVKRSQTSFGTVVQKYTYDGLDVIYDNTNGAITKYQNGPGIDSKLRQATSTGGLGSPLPKYFLADHLGSTVALTNSSGSVTDTNSYDSFGNPASTGFATRYMFTGREYDATTGLQFSRARWYDPQLGRFISEDPMGFRGGDVNLYGYVKNNSVNRADPMGLFDPADWRAAYDAARAAAVGGAGAGAAGLGAYAAVGFGGFALGYGIGYYPGQWSARSPYNPYVNGPLNPFGTPYPMLPPWTPTRPAPRCETSPRTIPWTRSPSRPRPNDPDDDPDKRECERQWEEDREVCKTLPLSLRPACYDQAAQVYANCLRGLPHPNPWPQYPWD